MQERKGLDLRALPSRFTLAELSVSPSWNASGDGPAPLPVQVDPEYGTVHANISIPPYAQLASYQVSLELYLDAENKTTVATHEFQLADPRPPTAVLKLTAPVWVRTHNLYVCSVCLSACHFLKFALPLSQYKPASNWCTHTPQALPNATVPVRVSITSYLGADVSGATVRLSWSVPLSSGTINVTTDAEGRAEAVIPLGALPQANATGPGDGLEVKAAWVGPTGDPYNERVFVRCVCAGWLLVLLRLKC